MISSNLPSRSTFDALDPVHDERHTLVDRPKARESLMYMIQLPEHGVSFTVYTWVSAEGVAGGFFCAFGPGVGDESIFEQFGGIQMSDDARFADWQVAGVAIKQSTALNASDVHYSGEHAALTMHFEALHPAYPYSERPGGLPPFVADDRFEQAGRVTGTLTLRGNEIRIDTFAQRDHSWGVRDWSLIQHWKWFTAQTDETLMHVFEIFGEGRRWVFGYVDRNGTVAPVVHADICWEGDDACIQRRIEIDVIDELDRRTSVVGETFAFTPWPADPRTTMHETGLKTTIDGRSGVGFVEFAWSKDYLESMTRARASAKFE